MIGRPELQSRVSRDDDAAFHGGDRTSPVLGIVLHETDSEAWNGPGGTKAYLNSGAKQASYSYVILDDGAIHRFCPKGKIAWHAGKRCTSGPKEWRIGESCNGRTLGVAFINRVARGFPLSQAQLDSGLWLCSVLSETHTCPPEMCYGHREVAPTWKSDVLVEHLDMTHWREMLAAPQWPVTVTPFPSFVGADV